MMNHSRVRALALAALFGMATLTGCGSGDDESTVGAAATTPGTTAKAAGPGGPPIVVGTIGSYTGPNAGVTGRAGDMMTAWAKYTNAAGGINGHPVKVVVVDDEQNAAKGLAGVKKLVEQDKVQAIVGQYSLVSGAWEKYVSQKGVPVVGGQSVDTPYLTNPDFHPSGSSLATMLYGQVALAAKAGTKKFGLMYCAETPLCAQLVPIMTALGKSVGVEILPQKVATTAPNYTAPCLALKGKGADDLFVAGSSTVRIVESCSKQGYKPKVIASSSVIESNWFSTSALDGALISGVTAPYTDTSVPGVRRFDEAVEQFLPGLKGTPQFSTPLMYPWSGGELFAAAAKAAKLGPDSTPADVSAGLTALKDETLGGITGPLNFPKGTSGGTPCYFPAQISGGKLESTTANKPTCLDAQTQAALGKARGG